MEKLFLDIPPHCVYTSKVNSVQFGSTGGDPINTVITSREQLLQAAKDIAAKEGVSQISIRRVAAACGVSVGSIYNYFPTKADLVVAVIEDFWRQSFHGIAWPECPDGNFPAFCRELYARFHRYLGAFEADWLEQLARLPQAERRKGKETEAFYFRHIQKGLLGVLEQDSQIPLEIWTSDFTREAFVDFVFRSMLSLLKDSQPDCLFLCAVLERLLYPCRNTPSVNAD